MSTDDDDDNDNDNDCAITLYDPQKILRSYKNRSNQIRNKDLRNFPNMRFWPLSVLNISKTVKGTSNLIEKPRQGFSQGI